MDGADFIGMKIWFQYVRVPNIDVYSYRRNDVGETNDVSCFSETFRRIFLEPTTFKLKDQSMLQLNYWNQVVKLDIRSNIEIMTLLLQR